MFHWCPNSSKTTEGPQPRLTEMLALTACGGSSGFSHSSTPGMGSEAESPLSFQTATHATLLETRELCGLKISSRGLWHTLLAGPVCRHGLWQAVLHTVLSQAVPSSPGTQPFCLGPDTHQALSFPCPEITPLPCLPTVAASPAPQPSPPWLWNTRPSSPGQTPSCLMPGSSNLWYIC